MAEGASIVAGTLGGEVAGVLLLDVVPSGYSMAVERDMATTMISRNTTIPTRKSGVFTTVEDNQTQLTVRVLQGEESVASQNTLVGEVHLSGLPPAPRGVPQIEVAFEISVDNTLTVSARDRDTGREVRSRLEAPYRLNSAQINVLQRKVEQELQTLRRRELDARKREREEMTRNRATTLAKKVERFLAVQRASVGADEASLLDAQREVVVPLLKDASRRECGGSTCRPNDPRGLPGFDGARSPQILRIGATGYRSGSIGDIAAKSLLAESREKIQRT